MCPRAGSLMMLVLLHAASAYSAPPVRFNRDVRPILADNCFKCHGPDATTRQAELRFDTREGLFAPRDGGAPIVPGDVKASPLVQRLTHADPDQRMPPKDSGKSLTAAQIELLTNWVVQGAPWEDHWAFIPPQRPVLPAVKDSTWPRGAMDSFVLKALESRSWKPQSEAAAETLIRRVTLDLTGLPPTPDEMEAFLADSSPNRYEQLVDRLLASPRYGEHLAVDWLDAARYADSSGYQNDGPRQMWRWRDWVVAAVNANMPFDQFTREQLAGDVLVDNLQERSRGAASPRSSPVADREDAAPRLPNVIDGVLQQPRGYLPRDPRDIDLLIATGFQRNHRGNSEGGIIPEEYAVEYVADRVDTFGAVWLGLTIGCARCHSHKFDPITQGDYYRLFAYFNQVPEYGRAIKEGNSPPYITAPTPEQWERLLTLEAELASARSEWERLQPALERSRREWESRLPKSSGVADVPTHDITITEGVVFSLPPLSKEGNGGVDLKWVVDGKSTPPNPPLAGGAQEGHHPLPRGAQEFDGLRYLDAGDVAKFGYFDAFSALAWIKPDELTGGIFSRTSDDAYQDGWTFQFVDGRLQVNLVKRWLDDAIRVETKAALAPDKWQHVAMTYDGSRTAAGIAVYINGEPQPLNVHYDFLNQSFTNDEPLRIGSTGTKSRLKGSLADVRVYRSALSAVDVSLLATRENIGQIAAIAPEQRTPGQTHKLREFFLANAAPSPIAKASQRLRAAERTQRAFLASLPTAMVMVDQPTPRPTAILQRGVYDRPGEAVTAGVPAAISVAGSPHSAHNSPPNRLDLANWLVDPRHPLTARVTVNRIWQRLFGTGLVKTSEDFGTQGEPPSHPELLDWLATELVPSGWDLKHMHRLIVTSAAYRQSGAFSKVAEGLQPLGFGGAQSADPENRWLARGPRFRMSAEMVRDQALAVSGLLEERLGGPSIFPYQPEGLWQEIATDTKYEPSPAPDVYRRSLYCYSKRTVANPTMTLFDAPTRESCTLRRSRTSTPLQALTLWNDITFVEAARVLAERSLQEADGTLLYSAPTKTIRSMFRRVTGRWPDTEELHQLAASWTTYKARFQQDVKAAESLLQVGDSFSLTAKGDKDNAELAAYVAIASVLFNLDEAVTKE
jgi:hypothetical protein